MKNSMPVFKKPIIANGNYLLEFTEQKSSIRLQQALAEEAFGAITTAQSQQTNLPDSAAPQLPRIIFKSERKNITLSQLNVQLDFNFENSDLDIFTQIDVLEKNAKEFHSRAINKFIFAKYNLKALIIEIQFPSASSTIELQNFIYEKFFKSVPIHPIASAQCSIGYRINNFYANITASVYESRSFDLKLNPGTNGVTAIRQKDMQLVEQGVAFRIDFNNRPISEIDGYQLDDDASDIFKIFHDFISNDFNTLTGLKIK